MNDNNKIVGRFTSTIFHNSDNFYTVARFLIDENGEDITVVGHIKDLDEGSLYQLSGKYVDHPRFGIQFSFDSFEKKLPTDEESLLKYLSSPLFPGIGEKTAEVIINALGENLIEKIKNDSHIVDTLNITDRQKNTLIKGIIEVSDFDQTMAYLSAHGLTVNQIIKVDKQYGDDALEIIKNNPYQMVEDISGIGFKTADKLAQNIDFDLESKARYEAILIEMTLQHIANTGDSYILKDELFQKFQAKYPTVAQNSMEYLMNIMMRRTLILEDDRIYHYTQYDSERTIASSLKNFPVRRLKPINEKDLDLYLSKVESEIGLKYDESQLEAIRSFVEHDISILTGGPGTGKTTIIRAMVLLYREMYPDLSIALCAPTGRAAKRLKELTHNNSYTIHSLLKWDLETNTFSVNETNPLEEDILIIDEFSMVDQWLFAQLLKASANVKKILIVGDKNQLPSVLPGNVLRDLIEAQTFPVIHLEKIYRQKEGSAVVDLAANINQERYEEIVFEDDVLFINAQDQQVTPAIEQVVDSYLDKGLSIDEIQVLAPMYKGASGINTINNRLQEVLNPNLLEQKKEVQYGYRVFREGDKLLQLKNQTDDNVFNGDIGRLVEIEDYKKSDKRLIVDFDGDFVEYHYENFNHLTHAYCISIHKSQGSEYPIVIMPIVREHAFMLQKKLLYTGITRAKRSLVLIGDRKLFQKAIQKEERHVRKTTLIERLNR